MIDKRTKMRPAQDKVSYHSLNLEKELSLMQYMRLDQRENRADGQESSSTVEDK